MSFTPLPSQGSTSWYGWAGDVHSALTDSTSSAAALLRAALVPFWTAAETVAGNVYRLAPDGTIIKRTSSGTTRPSYDATEAALWTVVSGTGSSNALGSPNNPVTSASATRPTGLTSVYWTTTTRPTNAVAGDVWTNNA